MHISFRDVVRVTLYEYTFQEPPIKPGDLEQGTGRDLPGSAEPGHQRRK